MAMATANPKQQAGVFGSVTRFVPVIASTMAALTTVFSFLFSNGVISFGRHAPGGLRANWVRVSPMIDTAYALGDTIHLAATVVDKNGAVLIGTQPTWTSESPAVARVEVDGSVVARSPGATTIIAAVDDRTARVHVIVRQRVAAIKPSGDSLLSIAEGESKRASLQILDARGHLVRGAVATWTSDDTTIATVDSLGTVTARTLGQTSVHASIAGFTAANAINVIGKPASIETVDGASQHAAAGSQLPKQVVVRVLSRSGRPIQGAAVKFIGADGQGTVDPATAVSDNQGRVRTWWKLGELPGEQRLVVSIDGLDSSATIVAEADPVSANTKVLSIQDRVSGRAGAEVTDPVGVRVTDAAGRLLAGVPVTWTTLDGGSVEPSTARTDSAGEAYAHWTLGSRSGAQRLRAQVGNGRSVPPLTISATALAGEARSIAIVSGDDQVGRAGSELSKAVVLRVLDSAGNPVADATVNLALSAGSVADSAVHTDSLGRASLKWKMGRTAGTATISARLSGRSKMSPTVVHARATAGAAETLTLEASTAKGKTHALERTIAATVTDAFGNPVPDAVIRFVAKGGSVSQASAVSDAKGHAKTTLKLSGKATARELTATVRGTDVKQTLTISTSHEQ